MNKTSISCVVCFDIIDFSKKSEADRQAVTKQLNTLIDLAVVDIPEKDRLIVDTGHGAIITCSGSLENALEDALFIALTVRDEVLNSHANSKAPLYLLIGINLGSVKVVKSANVNDAPTIIGEGLVEAQRIMSFAKPNQILVSRTYYDMASKLTLEIAQMFEKYDMHAYEHDIYAVRLLNEKVAITENSAVIPEQIDTEEKKSPKRAFYWRGFILPLLLALAILFAFTKWMQQPTDTPTITMPPAMEEIEPFIEDIAPADANQVEAVDESIEIDQTKVITPQVQSKQKKSAQKPATSTKNMPVKESARSSSRDTAAVAEQGSAPTESVNTSNQEGEKSTWQSFRESIKKGSKRECTQAERALNQCN